MVMSGRDPAEGVRRAAILLSAIESDAAREVLMEMSPDEQQRVLVEVARLEHHPPGAGEIETVLREFQVLQASAPSVPRGGASLARTLLDAVSAPEARRRVETSIEEAAKEPPFGFLAAEDPDRVHEALREEHPQTIAVVLAHLPPSVAAAVLERLPLRAQVDAVRRLATIETPSPEAVAEVERALQARIAPSPAPGAPAVGGPRTAASILNLVGRDTERAVLQGLEEQDPSLVERLRSRMFTFEDLARTDDRGLQNLLREVDRLQLATALKLPAPEVAARIFRNLSDRAAEMLRQEIDALGPVLLKDVTAARAALVRAARQLEQSGALVVEGRGGSEVIR